MCTASAFSLGSLMIPSALLCEKTVRESKKASYSLKLSRQQQQKKKKQLALPLTTCIRTSNFLGPFVAPSSAAATKTALCYVSET